MKETHGNEIAPEEKLPTQNGTPLCSNADDVRRGIASRGPGFRASRKFSMGERRQCPSASVHQHHCARTFLVAIVVAGLTFAFGKWSKRILAGVLFGVGMAIAAVNFLPGCSPDSGAAEIGAGESWQTTGE